MVIVQFKKSQKKGGVKMYDKVVLNPTEAEIIYKEPVSIDETGRVILKTARMFQEFLGAANFTEGRTISKGEILEVDLDFPRYVPVRKPLQNWFQVALLNGNETLVADPLGCSARYKGFLPGVFGTLHDGSVRFSLEDEPKDSYINYVLFVYDSADYQAFLEGVTSLLGGYLDRGKAVVADSYGNKILVSDESKQPMLLIPVTLLIGGKDYISTTWEKVIKRREHY